MIRILSWLGCLLLFSLPAVPTAAAWELTYEKDVRPILKAHCFHCHGERGMIEGSLDLRLQRFIVQGGESGPAIVPGDAAKSLLIRRVTSGEMPPGEDKHLTVQEMETLTRWVNANAPTARPEPESLPADRFFTEEEKNWWAFRPLQKPRLVEYPAQAETPIDAWLLLKMREQLSRMNVVAEFSVEADRATLIRRLYLDLLGLPPTPDQVRAFIADPSPTAWNELVDRVLASPHYGERWGRHWLDAAGYADSEGYTEEDRVREHAYRYRDYVIRSFNADQPYSEFLLEQLAGDELAGWPASTLTPAIADRLVATGFLRMAPDGTDSGGIDQDLAKNQVMADTLQIVGTSILGLTIHCAQCHDHRYDPIPQRDYYQLRAIFEPALDWKNWRTPQSRLVSLYTEQDKQVRAEIEGRAKQVDAKRQEQTDFYIGKTLEHELLMVADAMQEPLRVAFRTPAANRSDEQKKLLEQHVNIANITPGSLYLYDRRRDARAKDLDQRRHEKWLVFARRVKDAALEKLDEATRQAIMTAFTTPADQRDEVQRRLVQEYPAVGVTESTLAQFDAAAAAELDRYRVAAEEVRSYRIAEELKKLGDEVQAIRDTIPKEHFLHVLSEQPAQVPATFVFHRGDHQQPKEQVEPQGLSVLNSAPLEMVPSLQTSGRRLQFARQLTRGDHPLVARVFVNRIWSHHFGRGLVGTTGDFGFLGDRPTHPELLDWLATEFVDSGWSVKQLHRQIVTSRAYRQAAAGSPDLVAADPDNRLLGRWPLRRLESETVRDTVLAVVGKLHTQMYGEPVPVMEDEVGQIVLGKENLDGERKPTNPIPLLEKEFRRSIYIQVRRSRPLGMLESFDLPDLAPNCTERASSNVTPQALMLMNSTFIIDMSTAMANRLIQTYPQDRREQLRAGWEGAFGVTMNEIQLKQAETFLAQQTEVFSREKRDDAEVARMALATYCQALLGSNRMLYIE